MYLYEFSIVFGSWIVFGSYLDRGSSRTAYLNTGNKSKQIWQLLDRIFYTFDGKIFVLNIRHAWSLPWKIYMYRENSFLAMNIANNHTLPYSTRKLVPCDLYCEKLFVSILISIRDLIQNAIPRKIHRVAMAKTRLDVIPFDIVSLCGIIELR